VVPAIRAFQWQKTTNLTIPRNKGKIFSCHGCAWLGIGPSLSEATFDQLNVIFDSTTEERLRSLARFRASRSPLLA
jgi:hypothetical protein